MANDAEHMLEVKVQVGDTYTAHVQAGRHSFIADEPLAAGGHDEGPSPEAYLLSALGACMSITLRMYANRKGWPLQQVNVMLRTEHEQGHVSGIHSRISLSGPLSQEQLDRLLDIARKCPMHKTLSGGLALRTELGQ